jgi:hypothetical protein
MDYMSDDGGQESKEAMPEGMHETPGEDQGEETAMLNKSILAGKHFEIGDEVVLRIVGMHDQEIEVAYAPAEEGEGEGKDYGEEHQEGAPASDEMADMMG